MANHLKFMQRALELARLGAGRTLSNPMVGSVLVKNGGIVAEGYHQEFGKDHAERMCINNYLKNHVGDFSDTTLYVTLEPCSHHGKTPPCADYIIENIIPKVVIAMSDPNPKVSGRGIEKMRQNGIEVIEKICEKEALELNKKFVTFHTKKRPYIILKWAQNEDGFVGFEDERTAITGQEANNLNHQWRSQEMAIMVGTNTVRVDAPQLTSRLAKNNKNPIRITLDKSGSLQDNYKIFDEQAPTIVFTHGDSNQSTVKHFTELKNGKNIVEMDFEKDVIKQVIKNYTN